MADISIPGFVVTLLLMTCIESGVSLNCYQCDNVMSISDCQHTVTCSTDEICYTDTTGAGDNTGYTLGCRTKQICRQPSTATQSSLIGRAVTQNIVCSQCCGVDLCNQHICASGVHGLHTNQCADDPKFNCGQISELFDVCNDKDHAKLVCRKFCGLCDIIDGYWLEWSSWSTCSHTCGDGVLTRTRICNRTEGGLPCTGDSSESQHCFNRTCPVDGGWTSWLSWSSCSLTCGVGFQRRDRHCSNPYPGPDGHFCDGDSRDDKVCLLTSCTDGIWAAWSDWGTCSASCQGGISMRSRQCNTPLPSSLGHSCIGNDEEYKVCNTQFCAGSLVNGGWTMWSSWSTCSVYCMSERTRTCTNPAPSTYGKNCLGTSKENKDCNQEYCSHPVRLVNGSDPYEGRLEVFHNGQWGTVCVYGVNNQAADIVCRMLNYEGFPRAYPSAAFGRGTLPTLLDVVDCTGSEESIFDCNHQSWGSSNCDDPDYDGFCVSLSCHANIDVRLVNGTSNNNGRLEVSRGETWGTVCDDGFGRDQIAVVCRQLGLPTNITIEYGPGYYGDGSGPSFITDPSCSWLESNLAKCGQYAKANSHCDHTRSVGLACVDKLHLRLVNGTDQHNGRVEASVDGSNWGPICYGFGYGKEEAKLICRSLGYPTNITIPYDSTRFGQGKTQHTLSDFSCYGSDDIANCDFSAVSATCSHSDDIGVECKTNMDIRLVNGTNQHNGRVEVSLDGGDWGPICASNFDSQEAKVVCRMMGYPINLTVPYTAERFGPGTTRYALSNPACSGREQSLADCNLIKASTCPRSDNVGVDCMTNINVRLVNGTNLHNGRVEVSIDGGSWGPICDTNFDNNDAKVICRMLGYHTNKVTGYGAARFGQGTQPYLLSGLQCGGSERSLADCVIANRGCGENRAAGVWCDSNTSIQVRLVNGSSVHSGRLEASVDGGDWGTVCNHYFHPAEAMVACRMLGFSWSNVTIFISPGGNGTAIADVGCTGSELSFVDCSRLAFGNDCSYGSVGVTCA